MLDRESVNSVCTGLNFTPLATAKSFVKNMVLEHGRYLDFAMFYHVVGEDHPDADNYHKFFEKELGLPYLDVGESRLYYSRICDLCLAIDKFMASEASTEYGFTNYYYLHKKKYDKRKTPITVELKWFEKSSYRSGGYIVGFDTVNKTNKMNLNLKNI